MTESNYTRLAAININGHIEKKGRFSYLSWAWAVDQLLRLDPTASWTFGNPQEFNGSVMVFCSLTAFNKTMNMQLPVINYLNVAIKNPNSMDVNTAMMRCLVKCIAVHGLGLYIYAGEDLPEEPVKKPKSSKKEPDEEIEVEVRRKIDPPSQPITPTAGAWEAMKPEQQMRLSVIAEQAILLFNEEGAEATVKFVRSKNLDTDNKVALTTRFCAKQRTAMTRYANENKGR
jgi:hypothetical protein